MQEISYYYEKINEATGGKVQKEKFMMRSQKWENNNIVELLINIKIRGEQ